MRIFLDANILFSAAKSDGAIRQLLRNLEPAQHTLVADSYVRAEALHNIAAKANADAIRHLEALLCKVEVNAVQFAQVSVELQSAALCLPAKDRPMLLAARVLACDVLCTCQRVFAASIGGTCLMDFDPLIYKYLLLN